MVDRCSDPHKIIVPNSWGLFSRVDVNQVSDSLANNFRAYIVKRPPCFNAVSIMITPDPRGFATRYRPSLLADHSHVRWWVVCRNLHALKHNRSTIHTSLISPQLTKLHHDSSGVDIIESTVCFKRRLV